MAWSANSTVTAGQIQATSTIDRPKSAVAPTISTNSAGATRRPTIPESAAKTRGASRLAAIWPATKMFQKRTSAVIALIARARLIAAASGRPGAHRSPARALVAADLAGDEAAGEHVERLA